MFHAGVGRVKASLLLLAKFYGAFLAALAGVVLVVFALGAITAAAYERDLFQAMPEQVEGASRSNKESCIASVYTVKHDGTRTASGIPFRDESLTAAHKTLPFGTRVRVTHRKNGRNVIVTITDRGPFIAGRCIDLSTVAARTIGLGYGLAPVTVEIVEG